MNPTLATNFNPAPRAEKRNDAESKRYARKLTAVFLFIAAVLTIGGYRFVSHRLAEARQEAQEALRVIADLKLSQISNWREERLADGRFFSQARFVAQDMRRFFDDRNSAATRSGVLHWLNLLKSGNRYYSAVVLDARLQKQVAIPDSASVPADLVSNLLAQARSSRDVVMGDLQREPGTGLVHLDILFPIFEDPEQRRGEPMAVVLLQLDARQFLFPLVKTWPTASQTAETLLVRREGDDVLYLSDLRHLPGEALTLRLPVNSPNLPTAKILRGETQVLEGTDYRGMPVVAAGRTIPGTSWAMVAEMDRSEIYAPLRRRAVAAVSVLAALLLAGALLVGLLWRQRNAEFLGRELELEKERAALADRLAHLMRNANDIILLLDGRQRVIEANDRALKQYGYTLAEIQQKTLRDLRAPESLAELDRDFDKIKSEGAILFETVHQSKNGSIFPVEVSSRRITIGEETFFLSILRNIGQRRAHELEIERLNRLYSALSQVNQAVVRSGSRDELAHEVCRVLVQFGGFRMAWIGWVDKETQQVVPLAQFGDEAGYLKEIQVFADDRPEGRGPVGTSIREACPSVFNDCLNDPKFEPWRKAATRCRWRSLASLPIRQEGVIRGALAVYAQQVGFFGGKELGLLEETAADISFGLDILVRDQRRREAERALREAKEALGRANADLERTVQERTGQLRASLGELEAFSYSLSHDMRAPLRAMRNFSRILVEEQGDKLDETGKEYLERIINAAQRLDSLIQDVLSFSRLARADITLQPVDVEKLVEQLIHENPVLQPPRAEIQIERPLHPVLGHAASLTQCLANLLTNAVKFVAAGQVPRVCVRSQRTNGLVRLWVVDNGIGIPREAQKQLFGLFQRVHAGYEGTGMGLAIVRKAADRMGGTVGVESEEGKGSSFWLELKAVSG